LPQRTTPRTRMLDSVPELSNRTIVTCSFRLVDPPSSQAPRQKSPDLRGHRDLRHNKRVTTILRLWANYPMRIQNVFSVIAVEAHGKRGHRKEIRVVIVIARRPDLRSTGKVIPRSQPRCLIGDTQMINIWDSLCFSPPKVL